jgi:hypothetical protein
MLVKGCVILWEASAFGGDTRGIPVVAGQVMLVYASFIPFMGCADVALFVLPFVLLCGVVNVWWVVHV